MPATAAQVAANRANALKSTGPKTPEGKDASRGNALKHGLTAATVFPEREAAEVQRRFLAYCKELQPSGEIGLAYAHRAATLSARMERCVEHETAMLTERVRRAEADFEAPEGCDAATAAKLRTEAGRRALFDDSKEATLARKYEAAAERGFFKALKELRAHERAVRAAGEAAIDAKLGSILNDEVDDEEFAQLEAEFGSLAPMAAGNRGGRVDLSGLRRPADVPISVGKRR